MDISTELIAMAMGKGLDDKCKVVGKGPFALLTCRGLSTVAGVCVCVCAKYLGRPEQH